MLFTLSYNNPVSVSILFVQLSMFSKYKYRTKKYILLSFNCAKKSATVQKTVNIWGTSAYWQK